MIANQFIKEGHPLKTVLNTAGVPSSSYYYKPIKNGQKKGRSASEYTFTQAGKKVSNTVVVEQIEKVLSEEFVDYGYLKVTYYLSQQYGYIINAKKTYRLMRDNGLLNTYKPKKKSQRNWVKELLPPAVDAFDYLEFDIKYIYIAGQNRNALLLSIIDVKTRWIMAQLMDWSIKQEQVISLFDQVFEVYPLPKHFHVRNDNGSQFDAALVQQYFKDKNVTQEFCKPATPEQNAHIESYHSILEKVVCQRYEFVDLQESRQTFNRFVKFYNYKRIHSGVGYKAPYKFLFEIGIDMNNYDLQNTLDCALLDPFFLT